MSVLVEVKTNLFFNIYKPAAIWPGINMQAQAESGLTLICVHSGTWQKSVDVAIDYFEQI